MADHDGSVPATKIWLIIWLGSCNKDMADHGSVHNKDMADHDGSVHATKIWLIMMARFMQQRYG